MRHAFTRALRELEIDVLGWRVVPTDNATLGASALAGEPLVQQVVVRRPVSCRTQDDFERRLFVARKYGTRLVRESVKGAEGFYVCSMSSRTIVYKGMLTPAQLPAYYPDLSDEAFESALALVHSRFSTNVLPTWPLAHPFRTLAHNGEINTLRGNINWMKSREAIISSPLFADDHVQKMKPIMQAGSSDSGTLDNVVEFLLMGGRSLPHVMMMLIPEAWEKDPEIAAERRAFYEYHGAIIEPWDGPASIAFTDGTLIGATLDRNGLRPSRYCLTDDNVLIMASEAGVLDVPPEKIVSKGRLRPGRMFIASLEEGRIIPDDEIKARICAERPYAQWLAQGKIPLADLTPPRQLLQPPTRRVLTQQKIFGYTLEDLRILMAPMAKDGEEPVGSMGNDAPLAVLSDKSRNLFDYFHQLFAQVTNPPIDSIREEMVMSLVSFVGGEGNILRDGPEHARVIELPQPVLTNEDLERLRWVDRQHFQAKTLSLCFKAEPGRMQRALDRLRREAEEYVEDGYEVLILSDRPVDSDHAAIPSLLAVSAVHHHLIRKGLRSRCGLIVETGEAREVHHFACLLGFGASAINPYLAFDTIEDMRRRQMLPERLTTEEARKHYLKAVGKGLLKTMSKMGISTISSYIGAQIFEAVGLSDALIEDSFPGTVSRIGGIDVATVERETLMRHAAAYPAVEVEDDDDLEAGGLYQWRQRGERHLHNPTTIHKLQQAARTNDPAVYPRVRPHHRRRRRGARHAAPPARVREPGARADRGGRARRVDREALRLGGHVVRVDLVGGAHDAGDRHEPPRRPVEHRRGRRGPRPVPAVAERGQHALGDQAGGLGTLRGDVELPGQRRRAADQDGAGSQARRGRTAPGPQGGQADREDAPLDPLRRAHLAAAAPRHLLDRGPRPAHLRPEERQPAGAGQREAGGRGRAWERSPPASPRRTRTRSWSAARTAAPAPRPSRRSSTRGSPGSSAWPRPTRC